MKSVNDRKREVKAEVGHFGHGFATACVSVAIFIVIVVTFSYGTRHGTDRSYTQEELRGLVPVLAVVMLVLPVLAVALSTRSDRKQMFRLIEKWEEEDQHDLAAMSEEHDELAGDYLELVVLYHEKADDWTDDGRHLDGRISDGLSGLATQLKLAQDEVIRVQQNLLSHPPSNRQLEEERVSLVSSRFEYAKKRFWYVRDGLEPISARAALIKSWQNALKS